MSIFESKSYIEYLNSQINTLNSPIKKRGGIKSLASAIGCHPTFISQILHGKSHFNTDQAVICCKYFQLSEDESEFFLDLLNYERSCNTQSKVFFFRIIQKKLKLRKNLYQRIKTKNKLQVQQELLYFSHWSIPVIHAILQLPDLNESVSISKALNISLEIVSKALLTLKEISLVEEKSGIWKLKNQDLHIANKSPAVNNFHIHWRLNSANKLMKLERTLEEIHYSSIFAISRETADKIRALLLDEIQVHRQSMNDSLNPTKLYAFTLDFYPVI